MRVGGERGSESDKAIEERERGEGGGVSVYNVMQFLMC